MLTDNSSYEPYTVNGQHSLQARALHQNEKLSVIQFGLVKVHSQLCKI
jgi:hypothetical protein